MGFEHVVYDIFSGQDWRISSMIQAESSSWKVFKFKFSLNISGISVYTFEFSSISSLILSVFLSILSMICFVLLSMVFFKSPKHKPILSETTNSSAFSSRLNSSSVAFCKTD